MNKEEFYNRCYEILGVGEEYKDIQYNQRRTNRWGPRQPGNGRYPGFGLIRWFSENNIHLISSSGSKVFDSPEALFDYIETL